MKTYEGFTGERVRVLADTEEQARAKIARGDYETIETETFFDFVSAPEETEADYLAKKIERFSSAMNRRDFWEARALGLDLHYWADHEWRNKNGGK